MTDAIGEPGVKAGHDDAALSMQRDTSRDRLRGLAIVLGAVTVYALLHTGFRLLASNVLGEDDVVDIILSQDLLAGYDAFPRQPPLYDWVLWVLQQVFGPRFENILGIKYAALIASAGFLYLAALRALGDRLFALLTVESLALIYSISWRYHEGFTHEVGAMVAVLATTWLLLRVLQEGQAVDYAGLAVAMGLGFLTEPAYTVFLATLLAAALLQPAMRAAILCPPFLMALLAAIVIASPYLLWMLDEPRRLYWLTRVWHDGWSLNAKGVWGAIRGPLAYLSPLLFILPVIFPGWLKRAWADLKGVPTDNEPSEYERLILNATCLAFLVSIGGALVFEIRGMAVHVLMPLYLSSVIWLFGVAKRSDHEPLHVQRFGRLALAIALVAFVARMANLYVMDPVCQTCRWGVPFEKLALEMRARGVDDGSTIISLDHEASGNLRTLFPNSPVITRRYPNFTPEGADWTRGRVAYLWSGQLPMDKVQRYLRFVLPKGIEARDGERLVVPWRSLWRENGYRTSIWYLLVLEKGAKKRIVNTGRERRLGL